MLDMNIIPTTQTKCHRCNKRLKEIQYGLRTIDVKNSAINNASYLLCIGCLKKLYSFLDGRQVKCLR